MNGRMLPYLVGFLLLLAADPHTVQAADDEAGFESLFDGK